MRVEGMGSDTQQQFCLRWHNYQNSLLTTLPQLLDGEDLTDVTLCAGGRSIKAHRIVLSACSQYFKDIFRELGPVQHPVIVIPGGEFSELCALVTFMYSGEVNIYQHQLPGLLAMADTLHIRGLAQFSPECDRREEGVEPCKRAKLNEVGSLDTYSGNRLSGMLMRKNPSTISNANANKAGRTQEVAEDLSKRPVPETSQGESSIRSKLYATCFVCGKQLSNQYNLRVHMETHQNAHYACASCSHVSRSRDALRKHVSYRHPPPSSATSTPDKKQPPAT